MFYFARYASKDIVIFAISLLIATLPGESTAADVDVLPIRPSATAKDTASVAHELT